MKFDSIDAALAAAAGQGAAAFRLNLKVEEIEGLRAAGLLGEATGPNTLSPGAYAGVNVYPTWGESELLAQPSEELRALHYPVVLDAP